MPQTINLILNRKHPLRNMKRSLFAVLLLFMAGTSGAQHFYSYYDAGNMFYAKGDWYSAAQYYERYLDPVRRRMDSLFNPYVIKTANPKRKPLHESNLKRAIFHTAECYRHLHYPEKAIGYYRLAAQFKDNPYPIARFHYAVALKSLSEFAEARIQFEMFLSAYTGSKDTLQLARQELLNLTFIKRQMSRTDLNRFKVTQVASGAGKFQAVYAPVHNKHGQLYVTGTRADTLNRIPVFYNQVYPAQLDSLNVRITDSVIFPAEAGLHQGVISFSPDGATVYFTRWTYDNGERRASLYLSRFKSKTWSAPEKLSKGKSNEQQPYVLPDGRFIIFSSDKPGGEGGFDLYKAPLREDGTPGDPVNLGKTINTPMDELAPYYHARTRTLVFASNGRTGMGNFDLYSSVEGNPQWNEPVNLGYPVNSVRDDLYFYTGQESKRILDKAWISSDRYSNCCLGIVQVQQQYPGKRILGRVVECEDRRPLPDAHVRYIETVSGDSTRETFTDASGNYALVIDPAADYTIIVTAKDHFTATFEHTGVDDENLLEIRDPERCVRKVIYNRPQNFPNIYFEYASAVVNDSSKQSLDSLARVLKSNPDLRIEIACHTDSIGNDVFNQRLSERRAAAVREQLRLRGIGEDRMISRGYGESRPVAPNSNTDGTDNPEGRALNRRCTLTFLE